MRSAIDLDVNPTDTVNTIRIKTGLTSRRGTHFRGTEVRRHLRLPDQAALNRWISADGVGGMFERFDFLVINRACRNGLTLDKPILPAIADRKNNFSVFFTGSAT